MTPQELAAKLNGRQYNYVITDQAKEVAEENDLVVVYGHSDDCLEFRGAIHDEKYVYDGDKYYVTVGGAILGKDDLEHEKEVLHRHKLELPPIRTVEAIWCPEGLEASWLITTEGGASFDIYDDDELFCRGVVFKL